MILFDPIFQGLAISLMAGEVASLLLSRMTVPVLLYMTRKHEMRHAAARTIPPVETSGGNESSIEIPALGGLNVDEMKGVL